MLELNHQVLWAKRRRVGHPQRAFLGTTLKYTYVYLHTYVRVNGNNVQRERCELSFIWGRTRTVAGDTGFQAALSSCSEEVRRSVYM